MRNKSNKRYRRDLRPLTSDPPAFSMPPPPRTSPTRLRPVHRECESCCAYDCGCDGIAEVVVVPGSRLHGHHQTVNVITELSVLSVLDPRFTSGVRALVIVQILFEQWIAIMQATKFPRKMRSNSLLCVCVCVCPYV